MTTGDRTRVDTVTAANVSTEDYDYDTEGRVSSIILTLADRPSYPLDTDYIYDTLDRAMDVRYPAQYGVVGSPRKLVHYDYDAASRLSGLKVDGTSHASSIAYNPASQTTSLKVGTGANQLTESYTYEALTGLTSTQKVQRGTTTLLDLSYDYLQAGTTSGRTGQLTKITNNLNSGRSRTYEYDALGRLKKATGSSATPWTQTYTYDRYGNRQTVTATGSADGGSGIPRDGFASLSYSAATNRVSTAGWQYDAAGNQTRAQSPGGAWQRYQYDAAGRLVKVTNDLATQDLAVYTYGSSNQRLITREGNLQTYYSWAGETVVAEYSEADLSGVVQWAKSYVYLGGRLLSTIAPGATTERVEYQHPDRLGTRLVTNNADTTAFEQTSLPFGVALDAESTGESNRRFTSYDRSTTTGLDYAVNRHYDSKQGRFTQVDPLGIGASSLANPQSLNLYAYCGNDPVNRLDPNGLFWGKLFRFFGKIAKVFNKIIKWALVALAVAVAVVAIVVSPAAAFQLLLTVGRFLIKIGIFKSTPLIYGAAETGAKIGLGVVGKILIGVETAGALSNHLDKKKNRKKRIIKSAYESALWRLRNMPGCKEFIQEEFQVQDPEATLQAIYDNGQIVPMPGGPQVAQTEVGAGPNAQIRLYDKFFDDPTVGGWVGTMNRGRTRTLVLLHELKHAVGTPHDVHNGVARDDSYFYKGIAKKCFGVNAP
jgi:RHS repeat-associated protein